MIGEVDRDLEIQTRWDSDDVLLANDFASRGWPAFFKNGHGEVVAVAEGVMLFDHLPGVKGIPVQISYNTCSYYLQIRLGLGQSMSSDAYFNGVVTGVAEAPFKIVKVLAEQLYNRVFLGGDLEEIQANPWGGCQCEGQGLVDSVHCPMCQGFSLEDWIA